MIRKICVTGGIASGKTTVVNLFGRLGGLVVSADEIARSLMLGKELQADHVPAKFLAVFGLVPALAFQSDPAGAPVFDHHQGVAKTAVRRGVVCHERSGSARALRAA